MTDDRVPDSLVLFMRSLGKQPILTRIEEHRLFVTLRESPDPSTRKAARDELTRRNVPLVYNIARRYAWSTLSLQDLLMEGVVGLIRAIDKFDHNSPYKLSTYATWWIKQSIMRAIGRNYGDFKVPSHIQPILLRIRKYSTQFLTKNGRPPTRAEIIDNVKEKRSYIEEALDLLEADVLRLDTSIDGSEANLHDAIEDPDGESALDRISILDVDTLLADISDYDKNLLKLRFGLNGTPAMTLEEVGHILGITRERVRQRQDNALRVLRDLLDVA